MVDWNNISCKTCQHRKRCKGISKGSKSCQEKLGLVSVEKEKEINPHIMLWGLYNKYGGKPNE